MKRLLGLLLVMGMVGCGGGDEAPPASETALPATPNKPQANVDEPPVQTVDPSKLVRRGLPSRAYEGYSKKPFTGVAVDKHENGQQSVEITYKDGKLEGPVTGWYENGKKRRQRTYKDAKKVSETW